MKNTHKKHEDTGLYYRFGGCYSILDGRCRVDPICVSWGGRGGF